MNQNKFRLLKLSPPNCALHPTLDQKADRICLSQTCRKYFTPVCASCVNEHSSHQLFPLIAFLIEANNLDEQRVSMLEGTGLQYKTEIDLLTDLSERIQNQQLNLDPEQ